MLISSLLQGGREFVLRAHFGLPTVEAGECECVCVCGPCPLVHVYACACGYTLCMVLMALPLLPPEEGEGRPPIKVQFEIPYFTTSGIQVLELYRLTGSFQHVFILHVCSPVPGPIFEDH